MPIPTPNAGESEDEFIGRCMGSDSMMSEYPDQEQRAAVCYSSWRDKHGGRPPDDKDAKPVQHKSYSPIVVREIDDDERSVKSVITTDSVDRDGDVVVPSGLRFDNYLKNPVALFNHDKRLVVGRTAWLQRGKREITAKTIYAKTPLGDEVYGLIREGMMRGKSIGMDPATVKWRRCTAKDIRDRPEWKDARGIIERAEIVEISDCAVPANAEALHKAYKDGLIVHTRSHWPEPPKQPTIVRIPVEPPHVRRAAPRVKVVKQMTAEDVKHAVRRALDTAKGAVN